MTPSNLALNDHQKWRFGFEEPYGKWELYVNRKTRQIDGIKLLDQNTYFLIGSYVEIYLGNKKCTPAIIRKIVLDTSNKNNPLYLKIDWVIANKIIPERSDITVCAINRQIKHC